MLISVASGKGGTGKTTVATNLAMVLDGPVGFLDCDVEEPNAHLFLRPEMTASEDFFLEIPEIDAKRCTLCGKCQELCQYNAIAILPETFLTFAELCHSCGGCFRVCPEHAIRPDKRLIGTVESGRRGPMRFAHGRLRVGEAMAPPLIKQVRSWADGAQFTLIDAPPGTSCPVVASVRGADFVVLVTEPTPFGLNDLELAVGLIRALKLPMGIVINRADQGDDQVRRYAAHQQIPILAELPFDRKAAETYARGDLLVEHLPQWRQAMLTLHRKILEQAAR